MKLKLCLFILLATLHVELIFGQDGIPIYSDYFAENLYLLHPSMAGAARAGQIRLTARQQWFDHENAPNLQTLTANTRMGERSGLGVIAYNDGNGYHSQLGAYITYAHHINFSRSDYDLNQFSFGLTAGVVQARLDETNFDLTDFDPIIAGIIQSSTYYNVDAGVSYNLMDFSAHLTVKNLLFVNRKIYTEEYESNNQRRYVLGMAYTIGGKYYSDWSYEPSFMFQFYERTNESFIDANFKLYRKMEFGRLFGGISYRHSFDGAEYLNGQSVTSQKLQYLSPMVGIRYKDFFFAYTYSHQLGNVKFESGGYHQITLGYNFWDKGELYDCNCPAVN